jgi:CubicO group peptidase (beta-lactamase class C family)
MKFKLLLRAGFFFMFFFTEVAFTFSEKINSDGIAVAEEMVSFPKVEPKGLSNALSAVEDLKYQDKLIENFLRKWGIVGASVGVVKDGKLVYAKGYGYAEKDKVSVEPYHTFRIASVSKLITAIAVMKLIEEDRLSLDDTVFGPNGILNDAVYCKSKDSKIYNITVRHLLVHTGGWSTRTYGDPMFQSLEIASKMKAPAPAGEEAIIEYVLSKRLPYAPGTKYDYSNFGYFILGKVIEKIADMPYETYVQRAILYPLDIFDMQLARNLCKDKFDKEVFYYDHQGAEKRLSCYGTGELVERPYGGSDIEVLGAAGAWIASPASMLKLLAAVDGQDSKPDILSQQTIDMMTASNEDEERAMGWKGNKNGKWYRTGTLIGTNAMLVRQSDGISWMMVTNTNVWTGPRFNFEINNLMNRVIQSVEEWPDVDLFEEYNSALAINK